MNQSMQDSEARADCPLGCGWPTWGDTDIDRTFYHMPECATHVLSAALPPNLEGRLVAPVFQIRQLV